MTPGPARRTSGPWGNTPAQEGPTAGTVSRTAVIMVAAAAVLGATSAAAQQRREACPEPVEFTRDAAQLTLRFTDGEQLSTTVPWDDAIRTGLACRGAPHTVVFWGWSPPRHFEAGSDKWRIGFASTSPGTISWTMSRDELLPSLKVLEVGPDIDVWWDGRRYLVVHAPLAGLTPAGTEGATTVSVSGRRRPSHRGEVVAWAVRRGAREGPGAPALGALGASRILSGLPVLRCERLMRRADLRSPQEWCGREE